ncbi:MAG: anti-sigma regulatory factor [Magnetococcales bacterium]|nr:anti-sigma regulatory factor [Magnetococcales bacterium]
MNVSNPKSIDDDWETTPVPGLTCLVVEEYHIALVRTRAMALARQVGFKEAEVHALGTIVSELAANQFWHATHGGFIRLTPLRKDGKMGIEVVAEDTGPGIPDMEKAMQDHFSTTGSMGCGLPGVKRLADAFEIFSTPGHGSRIIAYKWRKRL